MSRSPRMLSWCVVVLFIVAAAPAIGFTSEGTDPLVTHRHLLSTNPILDMFSWFNLEYEYKVATNGTVGLAGSFISLDDDEDSFTSVSGFYRHYPQYEALLGFFLGGRFGVYYVTAEDDDEEESATFYGFGLDIGYTWLLGRSRTTAISLGIGAVRLLGGDLEDVALTLPTVRLVNIGIAF